MTAKTNRTYSAEWISQAGTVNCGHDHRSPEAAWNCQRRDRVTPYEAMAVEGQPPSRVVPSVPLEEAQA